MITLTLPFPPSIWNLYTGTRKRRHKSDEYKQWINAAHSRFVWQRNQLAKKGMKFDPVTGHFCISIHLNQELRKPLMDVDNYAKAPLDWLQRVELIENDRFCDSCAVSWVKLDVPCEIKVTK